MGGNHWYSWSPKIRFWRNLKNFMTVLITVINSCSKKMWIYLNSKKIPPDIPKQRTKEANSYSCFGQTNSILGLFGCFKSFVIKITTTILFIKSRTSGRAIGHWERTVFIKREVLSLSSAKCWILFCDLVGNKIGMGPIIPEFIVTMFKWNKLHIKM